MSIVRVALYLKAATADQAEQREQRLRTYVAGQPGWKIRSVWTDFGSGRHRPALQQAIGAAEDGQFDVLLLDAIDTLPRRGGIHEMVERLHAANVTVRTVDGFDSAQPAAVMVLSVLDSTHERWRQRIQDGIQHARRVRERGDANTPRARRLRRTDADAAVAVRALYAVVSDDQLPWLDDLLIAAGVRRRCACTAMAVVGQPCDACGTMPTLPALATGETDTVNGR